MTDSPPEPSISVVIPTFERARELRLCLEGFRNQTLAAEEFEVIVVDDGSSCDLEAVVTAFPGLRLEFRRSKHGGPSVARNIALDMARAPLLLLYDDDLQPSPMILEYCLDFHRRCTADNAAALLYFTRDTTRPASPFEDWAFSQLYTFPATPGIYGWSHFWSGTVTCKKRLLSGYNFNPRYRAVEDAELAFRISRSCGLEVHFEPRPCGHFLRRLTFDDVCRRQRQMGYYRFQLAAECRKRLVFSHPVYRWPEEHLVEDRILLQTAKALAALDGPFASATASALWELVDNHSIATGWLAAQRGIPPEAL
jgi:glycosyltransferase involved in cell wall biosynthesis